MNVPLDQILKEAQDELDQEEHQAQVALMKLQLIAERNRPRWQFPFKWVGFTRRPSINV
jgi:hypothetical protein